MTFTMNTHTYKNLDRESDKQTNRYTMCQRQSDRITFTKIFTLKQQQGRPSRSTVNVMLFTITNVFQSFTQVKTFKN